MNPNIVKNIEAKTFDGEEWVRAIDHFAGCAEHYEKGFFDGADATGEQAKELIGEALEEINKYAENVMQTGAKEMSDVYVGMMNAIRNVEDILKKLLQ